MFGRICLLSEALTTVRNWTDKGALASMNTEVVEEVMPLPEGPATVREVTLEDSNVAHRVGVPELEDAEVLCLWDRLVDFDGSSTEILVISMLYMDRFAFHGNLLLDLIVGKLVATHEDGLLAYAMLLGQGKGLTCLVGRTSYLPRSFIVSK